MCHRGLQFSPHASQMPKVCAILVIESAGSSPDAVPESLSGVRGRGHARHAKEIHYFVAS